MRLYLSPFFPTWVYVFPFSHSRVQYFKLLDILSCSHVFKGSCHACVWEETFIERSKYLCQAGASDPVWSWRCCRWHSGILQSLYITGRLISVRISLVLLIMPYPGFLIGRIVSVTIRAVKSSYTLLSLGISLPFSYLSCSFTFSSHLHAELESQSLFFSTARFFFKLILALFLFYDFRDGGARGSSAPTVWPPRPRCGGRMPTAATCATRVASIRSCTR